MKRHFKQELYIDNDGFEIGYCCIKKGDYTVLLQFYVFLSLVWIFENSWYEKGKILVNFYRCF